jgi:glycosyltransferase involved in cell wall biosynthesis
MKRLLYVTADPGVPVLGHKGASVHVRELATALSHLGVEVAIASPRIEPAGDSVDASVELLPLPVAAPNSSELELRAAMEAQRAALLDLALAFGAEAIYERYALFSKAGVEAAAALDIPHVLEVNAPLRAEARRFRTLPHPALAAETERAVHRGTRRVFAVSTALKRWLVAEGVGGDRIEVVPNAVTPERFGPCRRRGNGPFVVGFCGSLKAWHGIEVLVEACARAFAEQPSLRLEVVGNGPLEHLLRDHRLPPSRLVIHGALPHADVIERLRRWDAGVAPYLPLDDFYFSPLKVLEYMAAGLCPVASALGDIPALLGEGGRGVLVPAGDADGLATALVELARDRELAAELGRRAREHVLEAHTWDRNARVVLDALRAQAGELAA